MILWCWLTDRTGWKEPSTRFLAKGCGFETLRLITLIFSLISFGLWFSIFFRCRRRTKPSRIRSSSRSSTRNLRYYPFAQALRGIRSSWNNEESQMYNHQTTVRYSQDPQRKRLFRIHLFDQLRPSIIDNRRKIAIEEIVLKIKQRVLRIIKLMEHICLVNQFLLRRLRMMKM